MAASTTTQAPHIDTGGFKWGAVEPTTGDNDGHSSPSPVEAELGYLTFFDGHFHGTGFNTIFRPNSGQTTFKIPVTPAPPTMPNGNVLELNLTREQLQFGKSLGCIPNRGHNLQPDIFLNGVPYVQIVHNTGDDKTGLPDIPIEKQKGIHMETGMWIFVPGTKINPDNPCGEYVRMASIPHGTTINAQGLASSVTVVKSAPNISPVCIDPFITATSVKSPMKSQCATNGDTPRIPQDLTPFIKAGTITQAILDNPMIILLDILAKQTVVSTITIEVFTQAPSKATNDTGGGTANIAFLDGVPTTGGPNATVPSMHATFWLETVQHTVPVPVMKKGEVKKVMPENGQGVVFLIEPPYDITMPTTVTVTSNQIQYSQTVFLQFGDLTWPHLSLATLVPTKEQVIPASAWSSST